MRPASREPLARSWASWPRTAAGCWWDAARTCLVELSDPEPLVLDEPPYLEAGDVERYVRRAASSSVGGGDGTRRWLAREMAAAAGGNFLVAQLVADAIASAARSTRPFPTEVARAFERAARRAARRGPSAAAAGPLAYALGDGLPDDLWLAAATALRRPYRPATCDACWTVRPPRSSSRTRMPTAAPLSPVSRGAGRHAIEQSDPGCDQRALWRAWTGALPRPATGGRVGPTASPYLLEHAAEHAASRRRSRRRSRRTTGYLLVGDLGRLTAQLAAPCLRLRRRRAVLLRLAADRPSRWTRAPGAAARSRRAARRPARARRAPARRQPTRSGDRDGRIGWVAAHDVLTGHDGRGHRGGARPVARPRGHRRRRRRRRDGAGVGRGQRRAGSASRSPATPTASVAVALGRSATARSSSAPATTRRCGCGTRPAASRSASRSPATPTA